MKRNDTGSESMGILCPLSDFPLYGFSWFSLVRVCKEDVAAIRLVCKRHLLTQFLALVRAHFGQGAGVAAVERVVVEA